MKHRLRYSFPRRVHGRARRLRDDSRAGACTGRAGRRARRCAGTRKERARPVVRAVQGERRSLAQAQSAQRHLPRRPALRGPARRQHHRRILCGGEGGVGKRSRRASRHPARPARCDRPARLRRVRIHDQGHAARVPAGHFAPDQGAAAEPFLRHPHLLSDLREREGRGAVQHGPGLREQPEAPQRLRRLHRPRNRPLQGRPGRRRRRNQDDRPQHDRAAGRPAEDEAGGLALFRSGEAVSRSDRRGGPRAADAGAIAPRSRRRSIRR